MSKFILRDKYFQKAKHNGYRARSAYKLKEIQDKFKLIQKADRALDLGCAPGSFLQILAGIVGPEGIVVGIDILPTIKLPQKNVVTIQGDIREIDTVELCSLYATSDGFNVITCDIAPNISGVREVDNRNVSELYDAVQNVVTKGLKTGGHFVLKSFFSDDFKSIKSGLTTMFRTVSAFKPAASRSASSEIYLVAVGKK
jgi:23S rRNA (uridine2552-2'-O)-methyltransferase